MANRTDPELINRFEHGALTEPPPLPHCQRWHVQRGANGDQAYWQCKFCRVIIMRVGRRHGEDERAWFDIEPCTQAQQTLEDPSYLKPSPLTRQKTTTGIETPPYPWPEKSATLEGLVKPGDRRPKAKAKSKARSSHPRDTQRRYTHRTEEVTGFGVPTEEPLITMTTILTPAPKPKPKAKPKARQQVAPPAPPTPPSPSAADLAAAAASPAGTEEFDLLSLGGETEASVSVASTASAQNRHHSRRPEPSSMEAQAAPEPQVMVAVLTDALQRIVAQHPELAETVTRRLGGPH